MKAHITAIGLGLALMASQANAIPEWKKTQPTFQQISNSSIAAGLIVQAEAPRPMLGIGGGYTIVCTMNALAINAQDKADAYDFFGPEVTLNIPVVTPGIYTIPGWTNVPPRSCGGQCTMTWKAEAVDAVFTFSASISGVGGNFTLLPAGGLVRGDTIVLDICRSGPGGQQCCTPGCQIP